MNPQVTTGLADLDPDVAVAMIDQVVEDHSPGTPPAAPTVQTSEQTDEPSVEGAPMDSTESDQKDEMPKETRYKTIG